MVEVRHFLAIPQGVFAFQSAAWRTCEVRTVQLCTQVRQADDPQFAALLNEVRVGKFSRETAAALQRCHETCKHGRREKCRAPTIMIAPLCFSKKIEIRVVEPKSCRKFPNKIEKELLPEN